MCRTLGTPKGPGLSISLILTLVILITGCGEGGRGGSVNPDIPTPATNYTFINKWGSGEALYGNCALAVDSGGNIYVADFNNNRIQKFNSSGILQNTLGARGSGDGQFEGPSGIAIDSSGNIYVTDQYDRIQVFAPQ